MIRAASDWCNSLDTLNVSGCFTLIFRQLKQLEEAIFTPVNCPNRPSIKIQQALSFETEMMNRTNISKRADFRESWDESDHSYLRWLVDYHLPRYFRVLFTPVSNLNRPKPLPPLPPCTHTSFTALPLIASDRPSIQPIKKNRKKKKKKKKKKPTHSAIISRLVKSPTGGAHGYGDWAILRPVGAVTARWRRGDEAENAAGWMRPRSQRRRSPAFKTVSPRLEGDGSDTLIDCTTALGLGLWRPLPPITTYWLALRRNKWMRGGGSEGLGSDYGAFITRWWYLCYNHLVIGDQSNQTHNDPAFHSSITWLIRNVTSRPSLLHYVNQA